MIEDKIISELAVRMGLKLTNYDSLCNLMMAVVKVSRKKRMSIRELLEGFFTKKELELFDRQLKLNN